MAEGRAQKHEQINAINIAKVINRYSGGAIIAPWEIDQLPDEYVATFIALADELPTMKSVIDKHKSIMDVWRKKHSFKS